METIESSDGNPPEAVSPVPTPSSPLRGHGPKLSEAVPALLAAGQLPPNLRPCHRDKRIIDWLKAAGYGDDLPDRFAISRYFRRHFRRDR